MTPVEIIFPNTTAMADFILKYRPSNVECDSARVSLTGCLDENQIRIALHHFGAVKKEAIMLHLFKPINRHNTIKHHQ